jgi:hypothetical protein
VEELMAKQDKLWRVFEAGVKLGQRYGSATVPGEVLTKTLDDLKAEFKEEAGPDPDQLRIPD